MTVEDAKRVTEETGCDGIMIGRGIQGNPWLFSQIKEYFVTGIIPEKPHVDEVIEMILKHAKLQIMFKGEYVGIREMRKHVAWYTTGYPKSAKLRNAVNEIASLEELEALMMQYKSMIEE